MRYWTIFHTSPCRSTCLSNQKRPFICFLTHPWGCFFPTLTFKQRMQAALVEGRSPAQEDAVEAEPSSSPSLDVKDFTALELFRKDNRGAGRSKARAKTFSSRRSQGLHGVCISLCVSFHSPYLPDLSTKFIEISFPFREPRPFWSGWLLIVGLLLVALVAATTLRGSPLCSWFWFFLIIIKGLLILCA